MRDRSLLSPASRLCPAQGDRIVVGPVSRGRIGHDAQIEQRPHGVGIEAERIRGFPQRRRTALRRAHHLDPPDQGGEGRGLVDADLGEPSRGPGLLGIGASGLGVVAGPPLVQKARQGLLQLS